MGFPTLLQAGKLVGEAGRAHPGAIPVEYIVDWLRRRMPEFGGAPPASLADRVLIVRSETGSGKSTALPVHVFRLLRSEKSAARVRLRGPGIICTQPRVLTAISLARDMAGSPHYPDMVMGATIGYQTGPINEMPSSGLIYSTAGILLAQLRLMPDPEIIARYRFIIIDEAHERALDIDSLLMRLKSFLHRNLGNPSLPFVLLASATLPVARYARYFGVGPGNVVEVEGRQYPVVEHYPPVGTNDYILAAAQKAVELHRDNPDDPPERADILIFMPGQGEIDVVVKALTAANWEFRHLATKIPPFLVLAITGEGVREESRDFRLLKVAPDSLWIPVEDGSFVRPARRVIVSTIVAETGLTLEALKYVIDGGWSRSNEIYFPGRLRGLVTRPAPKSRIRQRMGRAGREFPGEFHPLYTRGVFDALPEEQLPAIITEGIAPIFLDIVGATAAQHGGVFRVEDLDMLDPPPADALAAALEEGIVYGYLRPDAGGGGHALTALGQAAARFHLLSMAQAQTLFAGYLWRVSLQDLALVVALYEQRDALLYVRPLPGEVGGDPPGARALRAGLPPFLRSEVLGGGREDRPPSAAEAYYYRARLLISDDFIEALLAFEGFVKALSALGGDLARLLDWCEENGVDFAGAILLAGLREAVVNEALTAGLNPFWGHEHRLAAAAPECFFDTVVRLKHCIYAGLRLHLITYDPAANAYHTQTGDIVEVPRGYDDVALARLRGLEVDLGRLKPQRLVTNEVRLRAAKKKRNEKNDPLLYRPAPGLTSVLDGYVEVDAAYWRPRGEDPM